MHIWVNILESKYTVVMTYFLYLDIKNDVIASEKSCSELILEEVMTPFMSWYPTMEMAVSKRLQEFHTRYNLCIYFPIWFGF